MARSRRPPRQGQRRPTRLHPRFRVERPRHQSRNASRQNLSCANRNRRESVPSRIARTWGRNRSQRSPPLQTRHPPSRRRKKLLARNRSRRRQKPPHPPHPRRPRHRCPPPHPRLHRPPPPRRPPQIRLPPPNSRRTDRAKSRDQFFVAAACPPQEGGGRFLPVPNGWTGAVLFSVLSVLFLCALCVKILFLSGSRLSHYPGEKPASMKNPQWLQWA